MESVGWFNFKPVYILRISGLGTLIMWLWFYFFFLSLYILVSGVSSHFDEPFSKSNFDFPFYVIQTLWKSRKKKTAK